MECAVCLDQYNHTNNIPKSLPCGHTFCRACLASLYNKDLTRSISCPTCRDKTTFSSVDDIQTNFSLKAMICDIPVTQSSSDRIMCTSHQDKVAETVCVDCKISMCNTCIIHSLKSNPHANHSVEEVEEFLANRKHEKDKMSVAIRRSRDEVDEEYQRKVCEIDDAVKTNIESIKHNANIAIDKVREWEKCQIENISRNGREMKEVISTKYHHVCRNLETNESIQEKGLFDAISNKQFPSEEFVRSLAELKASCSSLMVTANLKVSTTGDIKKKKTIHVSKINLLYK